jgi:Secretion system C-terminal sorting domain
MKRMLVLVFLFFGIALHAQPVLNVANFPTEYSANVYRPLTAGFSNGLPGENQIWDYSTISLPTSNQTYSLIPLETIPWATSLFPDTNYCFLYLTAGDYNYYNFYKLTDSSFELLGYIDWDLINVFSNSDIIFQFPHAYNSVINDTSGENSADETVTRTYDAYGTFITPYATFQNVIRQKSVTPTNTYYTWYSTNPYEMLATGNFDNYYINFYKNTTLSVPEHQTKQFEIYPNPTTGAISIENPCDVEGIITVYDMQGNKIIGNKDLLNSNTLSLKDCSSGLYIVTITNAEGDLLHTAKIIKK